jgi:hypothetical protein
VIGARITLTPAEHRVVSIARALVDRPTGPVVSALKRGHRPPLYVTSDARYLIEEALAVGWVEVLAREGGWRRRPGPGGEPVRLWRRHGAVEMSFSRFAPELCEWMAATPLWHRERDRLALVPETAGDHFVCLMAARLFLEASCEDAIADVAGSWLVQLAHPDAIARWAPGVEPAEPPMDDPCSRLLVDGLGDLVVRRILEVEALRARLEDLDVAVELGRLQAAAIDGILVGLERAGAEELGWFALEAAAALVGAAPDYGAGLGPGSVAERAAARSACGAFLRSLHRWRRWADHARAVRFFDDGYERSQRILALWETLGDRGHARLAAVAAELDALS